MQQLKNEPKENVTQESPKNDVPFKAIQKQRTIYI